MAALKDAIYQFGKLQMRPSMRYSGSRSLFKIDLMSCGVGRLNLCKSLQ